MVGFEPWKVGVVKFYSFLKFRPIEKNQNDRISVSKNVFNIQKIGV